MSLIPEKIRKDFPIFRNNPELIYLDNAATTQKPDSVVRSIVNYYENFYSNVHRGVYRISEEATSMYESARKNVSDFIGSGGASNIVYTRNTTESINLLSYTIGRKLKKGDRILLTEMEHHSNIIPWYFLKEAGIKIDFAKVKDDFTLDYEDFANKLSPETKIASFTHVSNVLGTINDVRELTSMCHENSTIAIVDAAQSVPHMKVDVRKIDCDFLAFSGHKMLGPSGIGVLYGKEDLLKEMSPFLGGGEMIREVDYTNATWNDIPWKFEAGTQNVEGAIGLSSAIDYLKKLGMENVMDHERSLIKHLFSRSSEMDNLISFGPLDLKKRAAVFSFNIGDVISYSLVEAAIKKNIKISESIHPHDVAAFMDHKNIAVRSGHHCAMPLMGRLGVAATARASPYIYNTISELDLFVDSIRDCSREMKR